MDRSQERLNDCYDTYQTACGPKKGCMGKYDIVVTTIQLSVNETVETSVTSICLPADSLELKTDRMSNRLLHTESAVRYIHHLQVKLEYYYIGKGS
jgi:hypothetical protein